MSVELIPVVLGAIAFCLIYLGDTLKKRERLQIYFDVFFFTGAIAILSAVFFLFSMFQEQNLTGLASATLAIFALIQYTLLIIILIIFIRIWVFLIELIKKGIYEVFK